MAEQSPWFSLRESKNVEDRRDDPWPWHSLKAKEGTPTLAEAEQIMAIARAKKDDVPVTSLGRALGVEQVAPITDSELMRFITDIEMMNPYEPTKRMNDPMKRK